jgi:hypothetical protein
VFFSANRYNESVMQPTRGFLDYAYIAEPCSDIRFSATGRYLMVAVRTSTALYRCDPGDMQRWGSGLNVQCSIWVGTSTTDNTLMSEGRAFMGGLQVFGSSPESFIYVQGSFRSVTSSGSTVWLVYANTSNGRTVIHQLPVGYQAVGPPAFNRRTRRLFIPVHNHNVKTKRFILYQVRRHGILIANHQPLSNQVSYSFHVMFF